MRLLSLPFLLAAGLATAVPMSATEPAHQRRMALNSCSLPGITERTARCGSLEVPENPARPDGSRIRIAIAVLPARSAHPQADPIVALAGGPGESAIDSAETYARWLAPLRNDRDILLIDQRGTGRSGALICDLTAGGDLAPLLTDIFPLDAVATCAARLRSSADLTQYGYGNFARDIEQVRRALGYGKLNLFAGSYGTRALQVFLRKYPASVRTAFLGSVVPIDIVAPQTMAATAQIELDRLFRDCAADERCRIRYPRLRTHFAGIINRLDRGEVQVALPGTPGRHILRRGPVASWIRGRLYRPASAAEVPAAIDRADRGDWQPILDGVLAGARAELSFGLFFAITCNEDMRFADQAKASARGSGFLGQYRVRQQAAACRFWPTSPLPAGYRTAVKSSVPALFSTGDNDGGTPIWFTDHAAKGFANAAVVRTPMQGHTEWNDCVAERYFGLVRSGQVDSPGAQSCPGFPRPPFIMQPIVAFDPVLGR